MPCSKLHDDGWAILGRGAGHICGFRDHGEFCAIAWRGAFQSASNRSSVIGAVVLGAALRLFGCEVMAMGDGLMSAGVAGVFTLISVASLYLF